MLKLQVYRPKRRTTPVTTQDSPLGDKDSESFRISFDGRVPEGEGRPLREDEWRSTGDRHSCFSPRSSAESVTAAHSSCKGLMQEHELAERLQDYRSRGQRSSDARSQPASSAPISYVLCAKSRIVSRGDEALRTSSYMTKYSFILSL